MLYTYKVENCPVYVYALVMAAFMFFAICGLVTLLWLAVW